MSLQFDVDFAFIEDVAKEEVEKDEIDGVGEGCPLEGRDEGMDTLINPLADTHVPQDDCEEFAGGVEEERIDAKNVKECAPFFLSLNINNIHENAL